MNYDLKSAVVECGKEVDLKFVINIIMKQAGDEIVIKLQVQIFRLTILLNINIPFCFSVRDDSKQSQKSQ